MRTTGLLLLLIFSIPAFPQTAEIDSLRVQMFNGNMAALKSIGKYLSSKKTVKEHLGYHILTTSEKLIAARYIREECDFESAVFMRKDSILFEEFDLFLHSNEIVFNENTGYFIEKGQKPPVTAYRLYNTDSSSIDPIKKEFNNTLPLIMTESGADWSYKLRNPQCMLLLAEYFLKQRTKWNIYDFRDEDYIKSLRYMTHMDFAVPDTDSSLNSNYKMTSTEKRQNLYSYFYYHYNDFKWDESQQYFVNTKEKAGKKDNLIVLFEALESKTDSIAMSAFIQLCESDPAKVTQFCREFGAYNSDRNYSLPIFTYRFLPVIANLTSYFRKNGIAYKPSGELKKTLESLADENSFKKRYELENYLIDNISVNNIHTVEYFGLINESNFSCTFSIGRILDKWYSKNWKLIASNRQQLEVYLKKAAKFDNLGIIGTCNKYLRKFENAQTPVLDSIKAILASVNDEDIQKAGDQVLKKYSSPVSVTFPPIKEWDGEKNYSLKDPAGKIKDVFSSKDSKYDKEKKIQELSGKVSYEQIGETLRQLLTDNILDDYSKFNFLESDFGFYLGDFKKASINSFLKKYNSLSEKELYEDNLSSLGINIQVGSGDYDYNKIYEILKYDVVDAFVGGGGGRRDHNVYQVIKLLELKFQTTLGFINKLCSWQGIWGCDCTSRAKYWMQYMRDHKLVSLDITEPVSISYNN